MSTILLCLLHGLVLIKAAETPVLLIVVTTDKPETMIEDCYKRWGIETLFGCLKSRGFDLESTRMTDLDKMDKLMGLLALAFTWCLIAGHWSLVTGHWSLVTGHWSLVTGHWKYGEASQLPLNKHGRPAKSLFRLGLDLLRRVLKNYCTKSNQEDFLRLLNVLSRT